MQLYLFLILTFYCSAFKFNNFKKPSLLKLNALKYYENCHECNENVCDNCDSNEDMFDLFEKYSILQDKEKQHKYLIEIYKKNKAKELFRKYFQ